MKTKVHVHSADKSGYVHCELRFPIFWHILVRPSFMLAFSVTIHSGFAREAMANTSAKKNKHPEITVNLSMIIGLVRGDRLMIREWRIWSSDTKANEICKFDLFVCFFCCFFLFLFWRGGFYLRYDQRKTSLCWNNFGKVAAWRVVVNSASATTRRGDRRP